MCARKTLTIGNTDRYFNLHIKPIDEIEEYTKVTRTNENRIEREMDKLISQSKRYKVRGSEKYIVFNEKYNNDRLIDKLTNHAQALRFYTDRVAPYYVIKGLAKSDHSSIVYGLRKTFTNKELENIELAYMATRVIIDVPVVIPDINPYEVLASLSPLATNVDEVHVSFPRLSKSEIRNRHKKYYYFDGEKWDVNPEEKIRYVEYLRESLSIWKMYLYIVSNSENDSNALESYINKVQKKRQAGNKKKTGDNENEIS